MRLSARILALATMAAALAPAGTADAQSWWNVGWQHRRLVTVPNPRRTSDLPGEDVAYVAMPTGGLIRGDGGDVRVTGASGQLVASRVLMIGPGDQVLVAFALAGGEDRYYVYFGHPDPPAAKPLDIRRGVLLETWDYAGGGTATFAQAQRLFEGARELIGRGFQENVFLGFNPFGPQNRVASKFTGYFTISHAGEYEFACTSHNACFMTVDDKLVYDRGAQAGKDLDRTPTPQQKAELKAGLHKLEVYHVNHNRDPVIVAAWRPPGAKNVVLMPKEAFTPVSEARPGPMESQGQKITIDFLPSHDGEAFLTDRYYQRYGFKALLAGGAGEKVTWRWDFGDGQTSSQPEPQHVYLTPGEYTVTLKAATFVGELARTNKLYVSRPWDQVANPRLDGLGMHAKIVCEYDFARLTAEANAQAVVLLDRAKMPQWVTKAGAAFIAREAAGGELIQEVVPLCAENLLAQGQSDLAVKALQKGARMTGNPTTCATLLAEAGRIALDRMNDPDKAMALFDSVVGKYGTVTTAAAIQEAMIGQGDVWRAKGDYEKARQAYAAAAARAEKAAERLVILRGDLARHVEDYVRNRDFDAAGDYLDRWQRRFPADKLEGYWSLLQVRMFVAQGAAEQAAREADILVGVNPSSNYAAELLMLSAEAYGKLGKADKAKAALQRIVQKYPESPLAAEASKKLTPADK